jgi:hypothetical protein
LHGEKELNKIIKSHFINKIEDSINKNRHFINCVYLLFVRYGINI